MTDTTTTTETPAKTQSDANKRYTRAVAALKAAHGDEFLALLEAEYAKDGLTYKRRMTAEERDAKATADARAKAAAKVAELAAIYGQDILTTAITPA